MPTNFKNLDYSDIKVALIGHLKTLKEFQDYDFEASGIQQILSLLAYNTAYNAFYLNMVAAEMFLDSAQLRSSITSRAKAIGYLPRSSRSAQAKIKILVNPELGPLTPNPAFVKLTPDDEFLSYLDFKPYYFTPDQTYIISQNAEGKYEGEVTILEGKRLKFQYVVDRTSPIKQRFQIPNKNVDLKTLSVKVKQSDASSFVSVYSPVENIQSFGSDSLIYFIEENENEFFEVYFGEDIIGAQPETGNIVILEYVVTNGEIANGLKLFGRVNKPTGYNSLQITTIEPASRGSAREDNDSIKLLAPLLYEAQDRAVTRNDYEAIIRKDNPNVEFVRVWGGEDNVPPDYGKVYAAIKPKTGTRLSSQEKNQIANRLLKDRNVISVEVRIVNPEYLYMTLASVVGFKSKTTTRRASELKNLIFDEVVKYKTSVLNGFDADFSHSKLVAKIDSVDGSIIGNVTTIGLKKRIYPILNTPSRFEINFYNSLDRGDSANAVNSISSSGYTYRGISTFIGDDGKGSLYLYRVVDSQRIVLQRDIGSVDYEKGLVVIDALDVQGIPNADYLEIKATPASFDVFTPREAILLLEESDIAIYVNAKDAVGEKA